MGLFTNLHRLGLGAAPPKDYTDGPLPRRKLASDDKLLKQLLGNKAAKIASKTPQLPKHGLGPQKPAGKPFKAPVRKEDSDDEEEGRTSSFQSRKAKMLKASQLHARPERPKAEEAGSDDSEEERRPSKIPKVQERASTAKRPANFLDEVLAERSRKKKKKKKNNSSEGKQTE